MPRYDEDRDSDVDEIMRNTRLDDDEKLENIKYLYKVRLLSYGTSPENIRFYEKQISEILEKDEAKVRFAFRNFQFYENAPAFELVMRPINLKRQALQHALADIVMQADATLPEQQEKVFDDARRKGLRTDDIRDIQSRQLGAASAIFSAGTKLLIIVVVWYVGYCVLRPYSNFFGYSPTRTGPPPQWGFLLYCIYLCWEMLALSLFVGTFGAFLISIPSSISGLSSTSKTVAPGGVPKTLLGLATGTTAILIAGLVFITWMSGKDIKPSDLLADSSPPQHNNTFVAVPAIDSNYTGTPTNTTSSNREPFGFFVQRFKGPQSEDFFVSVGTIKISDKVDLSFVAKDNSGRVIAEGVVNVNRLHTVTVGLDILYKLFSTEKGTEYTDKTGSKRIFKITDNVNSIDISKIKHNDTFIDPSLTKTTYTFQ